MGNVLHILKRDIARLLKAPAALIVVGALLVLPSLYTWYNVVAFWNPYEATGGLKVYVVNQDVGTESELAGKLDVGARVTEELLANDRLNFTAGDFDTAMADLEKGDAYAVYVIPEDFSECLVSPLTGTVKHPTIQYYANEKLGPVSPKITDTAASTLEETINSMFVQTVSDAATQAIDDGLNSASQDVAHARSVASERTSGAKRGLQEARADLQNARNATDTARDKVGAVISSMDNVSTLISDARTVMNDVTVEADALQAQLATAASDVAQVLPGALSKAEQVEAEANEMADSLSSLAESAHGRLSNTSDRINAAAGALDAVSTKLKDAANGLPEGWSANKSVSAGVSHEGSGELTAGRLGTITGEAQGEANVDVAAGAGADAGLPALSASARERLLGISREIDERTSLLRASSDKVKELSTQLTDLSDTASNTANDMKTSARQSADVLQGYTGDLFGSTAQAIASANMRTHAACARLSTALTGIDAIVGQTKSNLGQLSTLLGDSGDVLSRTDQLLAGIQTDLESLVADARLLADSSMLASLLGSNNLSPESISAFMGSPTKIEKVEFYHPNAYGTTMSPLFMNLTFWIGAFMLVIIFRLEVDDEGVKKVTLGQRYLARFALFSGFAVIQALICCAGVLVLGVQVANVPAFLLGSAAASLAYLSIIYALSASLQHVGKALCIILVFAQIPGGSGLYPLELTDGFFQAIYPFLPFSYGIDALREAIFGFYGNYYVHDLIVLALMFFGMLVVGMMLVPLMSNVTRMAARQTREGGLYNGEEAVVPARQLRFSQVVSVLSDRDDYRQGLEARYARFSKLYPLLIRASIVLGVGVPVVLLLLLALDAGEKVVLLTVFLFWLLGLVVFLLVVESLRYSFEQQMSIGRMSDDRLMRAFFNRSSLLSRREAAGAPAADAPHEADEVPAADEQRGTGEVRDA